LRDKASFFQQCTQSTCQKRVSFQEPKGESSKVHQRQSHSDHSRSQKGNTHRHTQVNQQAIGHRHQCVHQPLNAKLATGSPHGRTTANNQKQQRKTNNDFSLITADKKRKTILDDQFSIFD